MDILYRRGRATGAEVMDDLPGDPSYSTVRTQLRVLEKKGHVRHEEQGPRYVYMPAVPRRCGAQVRAEAPRRHVLRRLGREGRRRAARRRRRAPVGGRARADRRAGGEGQKGQAGRIADELLLGSTLKVSLVVCRGPGRRGLLRKRSAAVRHWVLAAAIACAWRCPLLQLLVPAWGSSLSRAARFQPHEQPCGTINRPGAVTTCRRRHSSSSRRRAAVPPSTARPAVFQLVRRHGCSAPGSASSCSPWSGAPRPGSPRARARSSPEPWTRLADDIGRELRSRGPCSCCRANIRRCS